MPKQIARWNPARDVWETETTGLFCEHSDVFSATWPASGMTRAGVAYELPTSAHRTDGSASSSLLPTPESSDATGGRTSSEVGGVRPSGAKRAITLATRVDSLLPTPTSRDWKDGACRDADVPDNALLGQVVVRALLPTPTAADSKASGGSSPSDVTLTDAVVRTSLGASTNPRFDAGPTC